MRIVDGRARPVGAANGRSFDEFKPLYGTSLVTGWAQLHGHPIGILANAQGVLFSEEAQKATQFIQLANQSDTPLLFLHNTTGYMVGKDYEQGGIIKHGAQMINAVSNSTVPHLSVIMGASYGAGNYGMNGRAFDPRFLFTWPSAKSAVMGPAQLAGVLDDRRPAVRGVEGRRSSTPRASRASRTSRGLVEEQSLPYFLSGMLYDDGVIDPRDTRTVLAICLSVIAQHHLDRRRGIRGVPDMITQTARRQPRRDRPPGLRHLPTPRHRDRRRPLRRRRGPALRGRGRPRRTPARQRACRHLPPHRPRPRGRAEVRRRRDPPGLRLPVRERRLRPRGHRRRPHLGRPAARGDRGDGRQGPRQGDRREGRRTRPVRARRARPRPTSRSS